MKFNFKHIALALLGGATLFSCDLDEKFYSSVTPDTFITCPENTYAILCRPFTHWKWYLGAERWYLQELTTDEMVCPTRGNDFYNNGEYIRLQEHTWTGDDRHVKNVWDGTMSAISRTLEAKEDLSGVNYNAIGLSDEIKKDHINQLNAILGWYYMRGLDYFGGLPIFRSNNDAPCARSTDKETFEFCEDLFKNAIPSILPKSSLGEAQDGYIKKAAAAMMLAELYFNAEAYGGGDRYADCAAICEDLIRGEYGPYAIDNTWYGPHCFDRSRLVCALTELQDGIQLVLPLLLQPPGRQIFQLSLPGFALQRIHSFSLTRERRRSGHGLQAWQKLREIQRCRPAQETLRLPRQQGV